MSKYGVIPVLVKVLALSLTMPLVLMVVVLIIESLRAFLRTKRRRLQRSAALSTEWHQLVAHGIVLSFLFYPMLLREVLSLFACIPLDRAVAAPYEEGAVGSFWAGDMSQQCWQGSQDGGSCCWYTVDYLAGGAHARRYAGVPAA
jgi:hypothetical protein